MIRLESVCKTYMLGEHPVRALLDVSEEVAAGEHVAIMGPSGCGKSTLLHLIGCLDRPTSGRIHLAGREVSRLSVEELAAVRRELVGFVFQFFHLVPRLDAAANVELPMVFAGVAPAERRRRVAEALEAVGLADRAQHRPAQLSGGERQRVAIARAMIMKPRIILADEPTGNLDTTSGRQVLEVLEGMRARGMTLLVVTHDAGIASRAERIIVLADGRIVRRLAGGELCDAAQPPAAGRP